MRRTALRSDGMWGPCLVSRVHYIYIYAVLSEGPGHVGKEPRKYLVKWHGYNHDENTWEDESHFDSRLLKDFHKSGCTPCITIHMHHTQTHTLHHLAIETLSSGKTPFYVMDTPPEVMAKTFAMSAEERAELDKIDCGTEKDPDKVIILLPNSLSKYQTCRASTSTCERIHVVLELCGLYGIAASSLG